MTSPPHPRRADALPRRGLEELVDSPALAGSLDDGRPPSPSIDHTATVDVLLDDRPLRERAREIVEVPGSAWTRAAVHGAGVLAVLSLVAGLGWGVVGLALMALVLLGVTLARVLRLPGDLQLLLDLTLVVAAWAALLQLYQRWWWLDMVVHMVATGLLAVLAVTGLLRAGTFAAGTSRRGRRLGLAAVTLAVGLALAVVWEVGEWAGHTYLDPAIFVSYEDTIGDLAAGGAGSAVAAAWLAWRRDGR
ncbi:hypothetical protein ATJ97_1629 [Georgenia soli]|uniref:Uncharacterized protein n=1 Tax=Georgenia soli TaxID=638953 RepID=A0A2A9EJL7_9MICO|nr:hypothetical protein [Georgenia soli]PFG39134.1 hypothetical protein ATJ97_1629 [Georgenia soli]